jgi:hypothetical protein
MRDQDRTPLLPGHFQPLQSHFPALLKLWSAKQAAIYCVIAGATFILSN